jgi:hypothetical protein
MYSQALASIALCEAYAMSRDRNLLLKPAQLAIEFIATKQGPDGSWGYSPGTPGDTSIVGWNAQALYAALQTRDIVVPDRTVAKMKQFLDSVASGESKCSFGYTNATGAPGNSLTAVGLVTRHTFDRWTGKNPAFTEGVEGLFKNEPKTAPAKPNMYYYYHATRAAYYHGGDLWKNWNEGKSTDGKRSGGMRDWLITLQEKKEGPNRGSWEADGAIIGGACGKLGTTALSILTLEVYYRYLPIDFNEK